MPVQFDPRQDGTTSAAQPAMPQPTVPAPAAAPMQRPIPDANVYSKEQMKQLRAMYGASMKPNEMVILRGKAYFAHITAKVEGTDLAEAQARMQARGLTPPQSPYIEISITDPEVYRGPNEKNREYTDAELFALARCYKSQSQSFQGVAFNVRSQFPEGSKRLLPYIAKFDADKQAFVQCFPKGEPANGTPVMLVMNTFLNRSSGRVVLALNGVLCEDPDTQFGFNRGVNRDVEPLRARDILLEPFVPEEGSGVYDPDSDEAHEMAEATRSVDEDIPFANAAAPQAQPQPSYMKPANPTAIPYTPQAQAGGIVNG